MWLGRVPFGATAALQERLRQEILAGTQPETLLLLEHDPVITLGRSANAAHVLAPPSLLQQRGIAVSPVSRGGDVTYHGPGQLVGYPVLRLRQGVVGHMRAMADGLADVLAGHGIAARWDRAAPGLWVDATGDAAAAATAPAKICAFGVHVRQRVAIHGFALNVEPDLEAFRLIVPCGLAAAQVTSMKKILGAAPSLPSLAQEVARAFARAFGATFIEAQAADLTNTASSDAITAEGIAEIIS
ncbi:MAG TPA: lipoyl(octanoyl) transferase LipB [Polyangia bacterium]|nr:lipoyl(octanoyl) transferase LipB [Polyangia bacterium]